MKIDIDVLMGALSKLKYSISDYAGEKICSTEITIQDEDIQGNKLCDIVTIKCTTTQLNKYDGNRELITIRTLEIPGSTEGTGRKYNLVTETAQTFDLDKKE